MHPSVRQASSHPLVPLPKQLNIIYDTNAISTHPDWLLHFPYFVWRRSEGGGCFHLWSKTQDVIGNCRLDPIPWLRPEASYTARFSPSCESDKIMYFPFFRPEQKQEEAVRYSGGEARLPGRWCQWSTTTDHGFRCCCSEWSLVRGDVS